MSTRPILYLLPDSMDGNEVVTSQLPGDATTWLLASLVCAGIALMFHVAVTDTNYWRYVEKNGTVLQRDGLWKSCIKIKEDQNHQLECEDVSSLTVDDVFKVIQAANLLTFGFMAVALISGAVVFYMAWKEKSQAKAVHLCIAGHLLAAISVLILLISYIIDTDGIPATYLAENKYYTLQWCFYLAIVTVVFELLAAFLIAIHLRIVRENNTLESDMDLIQQSVGIQPSPGPGIQMPPQKPLPLIGLQQFQMADGLSVQSIPVVQPIDQNMPRVQSIQPLSVVQQQPYPVVQPIQQPSYPVVQPIQQPLYPVLQPIQQMPALLDKNMPVVQAIQPVQQLPVVQPIQPIPVVQQPPYTGPMYAIY